MTATKTANTDIAPRSAILDISRHVLASRRALIVAAMLVAVALAAVAALNWHWLAAVGAVSVFLSTLPCLLMCGLGLCMHKFVSRTGASSADASSVVNGTDAGTGAAGDGLSAMSCCSGGGPPITESRTALSREKTDA